MPPKMTLLNLVVPTQKKLRVVFPPLTELNMGQAVHSANTSLLMTKKNRDT